MATLEIPSSMMKLETSVPSADFLTLQSELSDVRNQLTILTELCKSFISSPSTLSISNPPAYKRSPSFTPLQLSPFFSSVKLVDQPERDENVRYDLPNLWCIIPAGGSGTRLWPLSREKKPKFLLDLEGKGKTLLQSTMERLNALTPTMKMVVVTGKSHMGNVVEQLPKLPLENVLSEPCPKDSMAALAFAASDIIQRDPNAVIASFPADHLIKADEVDENFYLAVCKAYELANESDDLITIGLQPTFASTGFGYIQLDSPIGQHVFKVNSFKEKPNQSLANEFVENGNYVWNAGMFVCKAKTVLTMLQEHQNTLFEGIMQVRKHLILQNTLAAEKVWSNLPAISIDHAIAEPVAAQGRMAVVCTNLDWKDVGDFASLAEVHQDCNSLIQILGDSNLVKSTNSTGFIVPNSKRIIACHGVQNIAIIDTPDALLVTTTEEAQNIKELVKKCKESFSYIA